MYGLLLKLHVAECKTVNSHLPEAIKPQEIIWQSYSIADCTFLVSGMCTEDQAKIIKDGTHRNGPSRRQT